MTQAFRGLLSRLLVGGLLLATAVIARMGLAMRRRSRDSTRSTGQDPTRDQSTRLRVVAVGAFHNPNWVLSHIVPLTEADTISEVRVVCSEPVLESPGLRYDCPPPWLNRAVGPSIAKCLWFLCVVGRDRPNIVIGYHIMPNALLCLIAAGLFGCKAVYQCTGGPVQVLGGGYRTENSLLRQLQRPSAVLERWMIQTVRLFDAIVVRGGKAREFFLRSGVRGRVAVITGSVNIDRFTYGGTEPVWDLITVGRIAPTKQPDRFLRLVAALTELRPSARAAMVGEGPLLESCRSLAAELGVTDRVSFLGKREDVSALLQQSKLFVLTSRSEGVSIAMLEAMACGLLPIVPDVGELGDFIDPGRTGAFLDPSDPQGSAGLVASLLDDPAGLHRQSQAARQLVRRNCSVPAIATEWDDLFKRLCGRGDVRSIGHRIVSLSPDIKHQSLERRVS